MTIQQERVVTLASKEEDHHIDDINKEKRKEIEIGLDFILSHLEEPIIFPRTIMTKKLGNSNDNDDYGYAQPTVLFT